MANKSKPGAYGKPRNAAQYDDDALYSSEEEEEENVSFNGSYESEQDDQELDYSDKVG